MVREARTAAQPTDLTQGPPIRCRGHREQVPIIALRYMNGLNLEPAHGYPRCPLVIFQRFVIRPVNNRPTAGRVRSDFVEAAQLEAAVVASLTETARTTNNHARGGQGPEIPPQTNPSNREVQRSNEPGAGAVQNKEGKAGPHNKTKKFQVHKLEAQQVASSSRQGKHANQHQAASHTARQHQSSVGTHRQAPS